MAGKVASVSRRLLPAFSAIALAIVPLAAQSQSAASSQQQLASLDPVVVTASRIEEPLSAADVVISVIDRKQILESGASSVVEFLDQIPGIAVRRLYGGMGGDASLDIGYLGESGSKNVLVLIDGLRINNIDDESVRFAQLPLSGIERVEIRGAGAGVLYGDRAMGGVVNIITRRDNANEVAVSGGSFGYQKLDTYLSRKLGDSIISLSAMDARSDGYRDRSKTEQRAARISLHSEGRANSTWAIQTRIFEETAQLPGGISIAQFQTNPRQAKNPADSGKRDGGQISGEFRRDFSDSVKGVLNASYDFSQNYADMQSFLPYSSAISTRDSKRFGLQPAVVWEIPGKALIRTGVDSLFAEANVNGGNQVSQNSLAAYASAEAFFGSASSVSFGIRRQGLQNEFSVGAGAPQDINRKYLNAHSIGWSGMLSKTWSLRAGYVSGFRFPTADELYYFNSTSFVPTQIHPGVEPMTSKEWYAVSDVKFSNVTYSANLRRINTAGEIGYSSGAECRPVVINQACNANLYDTARTVFTLSGKWDLTKSTTARLSWDWVDSEIESGSNTGSRIPYVPRSTARAFVSNKLSSSTRLIGYAHYRQRMFQNDYFANLADKGYQIPGRAIYDIGLVGEFRKQFTWGMWGRNLSNKSYYDFGRDGSNAWGGVYPGDGRSFQVSGTYSF